MSTNGVVGQPEGYLETSKKKGKPKSMVSHVGSGVSSGFPQKGTKTTECKLSEESVLRGGGGGGGTRLEVALERYSDDDNSSIA